MSKFSASCTYDNSAIIPSIFARLWGGTMYLKAFEMRVAGTFQVYNWVISIGSNYFLAFLVFTSAYIPLTVLYI